MVQDECRWKVECEKVEKERKFSTFLFLLERKMCWAENGSFVCKFRAQCKWDRTRGTAPCGSIERFWFIKKPVLCHLVSQQPSLDIAWLLTCAFHPTTISRRSWFKAAKLWTEPTAKALANRCINVSSGLIS